MDWFLYDKTSVIKELNNITNSKLQSKTNIVNKLIDALVEAEQNVLTQMWKYLVGTKALAQVTASATAKNIEKNDIVRSHIVTKNPIINLRTNHIHKNSKSNIGKLHIKSRRRHWTLNAIVGDCTLNGIESRRMNKAENKLQSNYTNTSVHLTWT